MSYKPYKNIEINKKYNKEQREVIAQDIIDFIVKRSLKGKKPNGQNYPKYSKEYVKSLDFKNAGKSKGKVNLRLSFEMLNSIVLRNERKGRLIIGMDKEDQRNIGKAEGNERGTYGQKSPIPGKARPFLDISNKDKKAILSKYPLNKKSTLAEAVAKAQAIAAAARKVAEEATEGATGG